MINKKVIVFFVVICSIFGVMLLFRLGQNTLSDSEYASLKEKILQEEKERVLQEEKEKNGGVVRILRTDNYQNGSLYPTELENYDGFQVYRGRIDNTRSAKVIVKELLFSTKRSKNIDISALRKVTLGYGIQEKTYCDYDTEIQGFANNDSTLVFPSLEYDLEGGQTIFFCVKTQGTTDLVSNYNIGEFAVDWDESSSIAIPNEGGTGFVDVSEEVYGNTSFKKIGNIGYSGNPTERKERRISYNKSKEYGIYLGSFDLTSDHINPVRVTQLHYTISMSSMTGGDDIYPLDAEIKLVVDDYAHMYPPIKITRSWDNDFTHFTRFTLDPNQTKRVDFYLVPKGTWRMRVNRKIRITPRNIIGHDDKENKTVSGLTYGGSVLMNMHLGETIIVE